MSEVPMFAPSRVLSCLVPLRPELRRLTLRADAGAIVLCGDLVDPSRTVAVVARRGATDPMGLRMAWLDGETVDEIAPVIAGRFGTDLQAGAHLEVLLDRVIDIAGISWEARGDDGLEDVAEQVRRALDAAREGGRDDATR